MKLQNNKTVYVRSEDLAIWEKAKELAGTHLSLVIIAELKRWVTQKEKELASHPVGCMCGKHGK